MLDMNILNSLQSLVHNISGEDNLSGEVGDEGSQYRQPVTEVVKITKDSWVSMSWHESEHMIKLSWGIQQSNAQCL